MGQGGRVKRLLALLLFLMVLVPVRADDLAILAAEFRQLRAIQGWFSGGDHFVDEVDRWGCRKQTVMNQLGPLLGDGRHSPAEIEQLLGPPDQLARPGTVLWSLLSPEGAGHCLVYYWRGSHDFLYFRVRQERVTGYDWWMAYE